MMAAGSKFKSSRLKSVLISLAVKSFLSLQKRECHCIVLSLDIRHSPVVASSAPGALMTSARGVGGGREAGGVRGAGTCIVFTLLSSLLIIVIVTIIILSLSLSLTLNVLSLSYQNHGHDHCHYLRGPGLSLSCPDWPLPLTSD